MMEKPSIAPQQPRDITMGLAVIPITAMQHARKREAATNRWALGLRQPGGGTTRASLRGEDAERQALHRKSHEERSMSQPRWHGDWRQHQSRQAPSGAQGGYSVGPLADRARATAGLAISNHKATLGCVAGSAGRSEVIGILPGPYKKPDEIAARKFRQMRAFNGGFPLYAIQVLTERTDQ